MAKKKVSEDENMFQPKNEESYLLSNYFTAAAVANQ